MILLRLQKNAFEVSSRKARARFEKVLPPQGNCVRIMYTGIVVNVLRDTGVLFSVFVFFVFVNSFLQMSQP